MERKRGRHSFFSPQTPLLLSSFESSPTYFNWFCIEFLGLQMFYCSSSPILVKKKKIKKFLGQREEGEEEGEEEESHEQEEW